jgi:hypothetical protein
MTKPRESRIVQCALLLSALYAVSVTGCGGTFTAGQGESGGASGATGTGGKSACTGDDACPAIACREGFVSVRQPGECCPGCVPGGSGGSGAGGVTGTGGSSGCGVTACPAVDCAGPWVLLPGECCPTCQMGSGGAGGGPSCGDVACPAYLCANHFHSETQAGQCCPTCVPDVDACTVGQNGYQALVGALLAQPDSESCTVDGDCTLLRGETSCGDVCTRTPVSVVAASGFNAKLKAYATSNCSTCATTYPPCAAPPPPRCVSGTCVSYLPL